MNPEDRLQALQSAPLEGASFEEAAIEAEKRGVSDPLLVKTPEDWIPRIL